MVKELTYQGKCVMVLLVLRARPRLGDFACLNWILTPLGLSVFPLLFVYLGLRHSN
jgi:hypothetical protein